MPLDNGETTYLCRSGRKIMPGQLAKSDVVQLRRELLVQRAELTERLDAIKLDVAHKLSADSAERAIEIENADVLRELAREAEEELGKVTSALTRLYAGKYGSCQQCDKDIDQKRLLAHPSAIHCMECAREIEQSEKDDAPVL